MTLLGFRTELELHFAKVENSSLVARFGFSGCDVKTNH